MKNNLTVNEKSEVTQESGIQGAILDIVKRTDIDPERLEKFIELQIRVEDRQSEKYFNEAFSRFQGDCPIITKTKTAAFATKSGGKANYDYAPLDEIVSTIKPHLKKHHLSFSFKVTPVDAGQMNVQTIIRHIDGHKEAYDWHTETAVHNPLSNMAQQRKSALSYAKRASLENALGLVVQGEDDDAKRSAGQMITQEQATNIMDLIAKTKTDTKNFLKFLKVNDLGELTEKEANSAIDSLRRKRTVLNKAAE